MADTEYRDAFNSELEAFKGRVRERAKIRIQTAIEEAEEVSFNCIVILINVLLMHNCIVK